MTFIGTDVTIAVFQESGEILSLMTRLISRRMGLITNALVSLSILVEIPSNPTLSVYLIAEFHHRQRHQCINGYWQGLAWMIRG